MPPKNKGDGPPVPRFGRVGNNLKMGIVGLPNVGKSSLFNLLGESADAAAENFPFCTVRRIWINNKCGSATKTDKYDAFLCCFQLVWAVVGDSLRRMCLIPQYQPKVKLCRQVVPF
jgi:hypothetical protein